MTVIVMRMNARKTQDGGSVNEIMSRLICDAVVPEEV